MACRFCILFGKISLKIFNILLILLRFLFQMFFFSFLNLHGVLSGFRNKTAVLVTSLLTANQWTQIIYWPLYIFPSDLSKTHLRKAGVWWHRGGLAAHRCTVRNTGDAKTQSPPVWAQPEWSLRSALFLITYFSFFFLNQGLQVLLSSTTFSESQLYKMAILTLALH